MPMNDLEAITSQDIINGKPHPEPYLKTAEKLGVNAGVKIR